jgi:hypothetical protein
MKMDRTKRKICLAILEAQNVMMWHLWGEYDRMLRYYGGGLSEKERVYLQQRSILMKRTCEELSLFRDRLYQHLHGTPVTKARHRERVRRARISQQSKNVEKV